MSGLIFDCEVFKYDWIVVFKDIKTKEFFVFHNNAEALEAFINPDEMHFGFNVKHYDRYIIRAIVGGLSPQEIKYVSEYIITGGNGWECPAIDGIRLRMNTCDLRDDCYEGLSLKAIEAHLGMDIRETEVDFELDRPLTDDELERTVRYCKHDVDATEKLMVLRENYLSTKIYLGKLAGLSSETALSMTNAKLTAAFLKAKGTEYNDERQYRFPDNILLDYIPGDVLIFFDNIHDESIPSEEYFKRKLTLTIGECQVTLGFGGIHGAIPTYHEKSREGRSIRNQDVGSYYPHLMTIDGYCSRSIPDPKIYSDMLEERMRAKKTGDKAKANALKLVANTTYGAMLNRWNDLYDPLMGRSVCITGQLRLLELAAHLHEECPTLTVVQLNTDGIMVSLDDSDLPCYEAIFCEWQKRTGFELEEDVIEEIVQKDVNNYIEIGKGGKIKTKGETFVRGVAPQGQFNINNNAPIVARALVKYFAEGVPIEDTINGADKLLDFQLVAKASGKYRGACHQIDGDLVPVQRVNRVYAAKDRSRGTVVKINSSTGTPERIANLPDHCLIDNGNTASLDDIDRNYYINLAYDKRDKFLGSEEKESEQLTLFKGGNMEKKTKAEAPAVEPKTMNIWQKLSAIRKDFREVTISKSGMNIHADFTYFELKDIIPEADPIIEKYNTLFHTGIARREEGDFAVGQLVDIDVPLTSILFEFPITHIAEPAKFRMNEIQACGAELTYIRRYLYQLLLNLVEKDDIDSDAHTPLSPLAPKADRPRIPVTSEERKEIAAKVTDADGPADEKQIGALKSFLKKLLEIAPEREEFVQYIAVQTKSFKEITKSKCNTLIDSVASEINERMKVKSDEMDN